MGVHSAGVVLWRPHCNGQSVHSIANSVQILLVHPGGPFWANKDQHGWSIPKGEFDPATESVVDAARREFAEELGRSAPEPPTDRPVTELAPFKAGRKTIHPVLIYGDFDAENVTSNLTEIEWPPRSGRRLEIPEVDRAQWCLLADAENLLHKGQAPLVDLVIDALSS